LEKLTTNGKIVMCKYELKDSHQTNFLMMNNK